MTDAFRGRQLSDPGFAGDAGDAPHALLAALSGYAAGRESAASVLTELAVGRVLVPVVALLDEEVTGADGVRHDKQSSMAAVLVERGDGERALLAFTSIVSLAQWQPDARPVPVTGRGAAQSALADGASTLLVDVAGPTPFAVTGDDLVALADVVPRGHGLAADPEVRRAVTTVTGVETAVVAAKLTAQGGRLTLTLTIDPMLAGDGYQALIARLTDALSDDEVLRKRLPTGLRLRVVSPPTS